MEDAKNTGSVYEKCVQLLQEAFRQGLSCLSFALKLNECSSRYRYLVLITL